jgi:hypothetical protein
MHWKTRNKILRATKLYVTQFNKSDNECYEIRIQIGKIEYIIIDLKEKFPEKIFYISLLNGGFNYDPINDNPIAYYGKKKTIEILNNSRESKNLNVKTIDMTIELIKEMNNLLHR